MKRMRHWLLAAAVLTVSSLPLAGYAGDPAPAGAPHDASGAAAGAPGTGAEEKRGCLPDGSCCGTGACRQAAAGATSAGPAAGSGAQERAGCPCMKAQRAADNPS